MDKWGRRWILFETMMIGGLSCISCIFVPAGKKTSPNVINPNILTALLPRRLRLVDSVPGHDRKVPDCLQLCCHLRVRGGTHAYSRQVAGGGGKDDITPDMSNPLCGPGHGDIVLCGRAGTAGLPLYQHAGQEDWREGDID